MLPTEFYDIVDKDAFLEQLLVAQKTLPKSKFLIVISLHAKVDSNNIFLGHVTGKHGLGNRDNNGDRYLDFTASTSTA